MIFRVIGTAGYVMGPFFNDGQPLTKDLNGEKKKPNENVILGFPFWFFDFSQKGGTNQTWVLPELGNKTTTTTNRLLSPSITD